MFYAPFKQKQESPRGAHQKQARGVEGDEQVDAAGEEIVADGQGGADERLAD